MRDKATNRMANSAEEAIQPTYVITVCGVKLYSDHSSSQKMMIEGIAKLIEAMMKRDDGRPAYAYVEGVKQ